MRTEFCIQLQIFRENQPTKSFYFPIAYMIFQLGEFLEIKVIFQVVPQHNKEILHHSMILQKKKYWCQTRFSI